MCGFCTEMMAIDIAEHLRDHVTISDEDDSEQQPSLQLHAARSMTTFSPAKQAARRWIGRIPL
jgi:hypothetical protein